MPETGKSQLEKFKEAGRKIETDNGESRFNKFLKRLAQQKPEKCKKK